MMVSPASRDRPLLLQSHHQRSGPRSTQLAPLAHPAACVPRGRKQPFDIWSYERDTNPQNRAVVKGEGVSEQGWLVAVHPERDPSLDRSSHLHPRSPPSLAPYFAGGIGPNAVARSAVTAARSREMSAGPNVARVWILSRESRTASRNATARAVPASSRPVAASAVS